jgi:hypothetical protein
VPSYKSIGRYLTKSGYVSKKCQFKPLNEEIHRSKRLAFANRWMENGVCTLENVIWSDETRVASHPNNRRISVWTNQAEAPVQVKLHSGGNSVMFWGSMSKHGVGSLVALVGTMDHEKYGLLLKDELLPEFKWCEDNIPGTWRFMQDGAPCHRDSSISAFLARHNIEKIDWPPYSPDLNPIENLWQWMKRNLETNFPVCESAEEIEARIFEIWNTITPEMCSNYCANYERRLLAVIAANGGYTKY